jgi:hypothetical protein
MLNLQTVLRRVDAYLVSDNEIPPHGCPYIPTSEMAPAEGLEAPDLKRRSVPADSDCPWVATYKVDLLTRAGVHCESQNIFPTVAAVKKAESKREDHSHNHATRLRWNCNTSETH